MGRHTECEWGDVLWLSGETYLSTLEKQSHRWGQIITFLPGLCHTNNKQMILRGYRLSRILFTLNSCVQGKGTFVDDVTSAAQMLKFLVAGWQHVHMSEKDSCI